MQGQQPAIFTYFPEAVFLDTEINAKDQIASIAFFGATWSITATMGQLPAIAAELTRRIHPQTLLCGHNIIDYDLPILRERIPRWTFLHQPPVLDSLLLSPLAFPKRPYHALIKDRELKAQGNDPLRDCKASAIVMSDVIAVFTQQASRDHASLAVILTLLAGGAMSSNAREGITRLAERLGVASLDATSLTEAILRLGEERCCPNHLRTTADESRDNPDLKTALAYLLSWLPVAGADSIIPHWVGHRFPGVVPLLHRLRGQSCDDPACPYCRRMHDPQQQLKRWFNFDSFRKEPALPGNPGRSLQEAIVRAGMNRESLLAILPTGGGKSLCFQIPALYHYTTTGALTVVISPLQALMKDQVENLVQRSGIHCTAALYGMLTMAERTCLLRDIAEGGIGLLYISPEQLRSTSLRKALLPRRIACWVYDEAHCLSKWGHDFRPDYLYAARYIRELANEQSVDPPPVCCVTATAKRDVQDEIVGHLHEALGHHLIRYDGGSDRPNLYYRVEETAGTTKEQRIHEILEQQLGSGQDEGTAVIFCATRKSAQLMADTLIHYGWTAGCFHAGLEMEEKKKAFSDFMANRTQVMVATNAFGMGVDKPDIRVVIHAEVPGSLENYVQEAGRAGRDGLPAECILLFDQKDIETQFRLSGHSRILLEEIQDMWRAIKRADRKKTGEVIITAEEILGQVDRDDGRYGFNGQTKVKTAIAMLEKQGFLERNENRPIVFQGRALVKDFEEGCQKIDGLGLLPERAMLWKAYLHVFLKLESVNGCGLDPFVNLPLTASAHQAHEAGTRNRITVYRFVINVLNEMAAPAAGILAKGILFSAWIKNGKYKNAVSALNALMNAEEYFIRLLEEAEPDGEGWIPGRLKSINHRLAQTHHPCTPDQLVRFLKQWERDHEYVAQGRPAVEFKAMSQDRIKLRLIRDWASVREGINWRHAYLLTLLTHLIDQAPNDERDALVDFSEQDVMAVFDSELTLKSNRLSNPGQALLGLLTFAHQCQLLDLQNGKALISSAMTLRLSGDKISGKRPPGFTKGDYGPLRIFYEEKILQVHVVAEYARKATDKIAAHIAMIADYFRLDREAFNERYLREDPEMYRRATGIESFRMIVDALGHPDQQRMVAAKLTGNGIILAGPGSGKTRVIVHRCAYLLRVERVRPSALLVLCFNRNACLELRKRIRRLVGEDARGLIVSTYHGLALRLLGRSFSDFNSRSKEEAIDFKALLREATAWLRGEQDVVGADAAYLRDRLMGDIRHILIDEYQDVDADEYAFIRALSGLGGSGDKNKQPTLLAVGDDDQSIYGFKGANVAYIRQFSEDYEAREDYLVENFRSTKAIIDTANRLIEHNTNRMKTAHPIRCDRRRATQAEGGRFTALDPVGGGLVSILDVRNATDEAFRITTEIKRLRELDPAGCWRDFAILARNNLVLSMLRPMLMDAEIPHRVDRGVDGMGTLLRVREIASWLDYLQGHKDEEWTASQLREKLAALISQVTNPWSALLDSLVGEFHEQEGERPVLVDSIHAFFVDGLIEARYQPPATDEVRLLTVHRAKGLEFKHVFMVDDAWPQDNYPMPQAKLEEERRIYFVGMTRAVETLSLLRRADQRNRFIHELIGPGVRERAPLDSANRLGASETAGSRRFSLLPMDNLYLSYAGCFPGDHVIHRHLAGMASGDTLVMRKNGSAIQLCNPSGFAVARLSRKGVAEWEGRLPYIESIHILAMLRRNREDGEATFAATCKTDQWEVPLVEIIERTENAPSSKA